ncbi:MAG: FAD-dependent oxidoreductase [Halanaerobium sp.]|nr:FAD-dependent oxidoreductase [Halanaerobium sp.]
MSTSKNDTRKMILAITLLVLMSASFFIPAVGASDTRTGKTLADEYDLIVVGGEPEGIAAAVSAARSGLQTLLVVKRDGLGGLFTEAMLNYLDIPYGINNRLASRGIFQEWHQMVGGRTAFSILKARQAFSRLVTAEENLTLSLETKVNRIIMSINDNSLQGLVLEKGPGRHTVWAERFIDATQDADLAVMTGVPYFIGGEDIGLAGERMAATLVIHLTNIDWGKIEEVARSSLFGAASYQKPGLENPVTQVFWGFGKLVGLYEPVQEDTRLRGLNIARVGNDCYINGLQIFGVDGLSEVSRQGAIEKGKQEARHILDFLQKNFPGFSQAEIASFPTELYIRETRHILAEYQLPLSDLWENKDHRDGIALGAYPVDIQARSKNDYGYVLCDPIQYAIPFRSLIPLKVNGLLVVGRSAGYSSLAAGSTRIVATGMATGEAAGVAAAISIRQGLSFREMAWQEETLAELRTRLQEQGAALEHFQLGYPYQGEWYYPALRKLLNYGLVCGGYRNDLQVDQDADTLMFANLLIQAVRRSKPELFAAKRALVERMYQEVFSRGKEPLTREKAAEMASLLLTGTRPDHSSGGSYWQLLAEEGLLDRIIQERLKDNRIMLKKEAFHLVGMLLAEIEEEY